MLVDFEVTMYLPDTLQVAGKSQDLHAALGKEGVTYGAIHLHSAQHLRNIENELIRASIEPSLSIFKDRLMSNSA